MWAMEMVPPSYILTCCLQRKRRASVVEAGGAGGLGEVTAGVGKSRSGGGAAERLVGASEVCARARTHTHTHTHTSQRSGRPLAANDSGRCMVGREVGGSGVTEETRPL